MKTNIQRIDPEKPTHPDELESWLQTTVDDVKLSDTERADYLKQLDAQIAILERGNLDASDYPDLTRLSAQEQHELNWLRHWERFDQKMQHSIEQTAQNCVLENDARMLIALEKLFRSCGDNDTANQYLAKRKRQQPDLSAIS